LAHNFPIGFITNVLYGAGVEHLAEAAEIASTLGFRSLEVGPTYDLNELDAVYERGLTVSGLIYCRNLLTNSEDDATYYYKQVEERIKVAGTYGIPLITISAGIVDADSKTEVYDEYEAIRTLPERSAERFAEIYSPLVSLAEKEQVILAVENCPQMANWAISPYLWRKMFEKIDSKNLGLAYDPSHFVWQYMDPYTPVIDFKDKIVHIHAKDTEILPEVLNEKGILTDFSWWRHRLPGWGALNWRRIFSLLMEIDYQGAVNIEHEDPLFIGTKEKVIDGLSMAKRHLELSAGIVTD
jgi:sugar phosphate isomerase/epimerase